MDLYQKAGEKIMEIEGELKKINRWKAEPLAPEAFVEMGAFGENTMSFENWIQFILIPRVQEIIKERGQFPQGSMVGAYAIRVIGGDDEAGELQTLLSEFDMLFDPDRDSAVDGV